MNTQEQAYHDYLFPLSAVDSAYSWMNIINGTPSNINETDYFNYWNGLNTLDKDESEFLIFSSLFDSIDINTHTLYETEYLLAGYSLDSKCRRKKGTPH